MATIGDLVVNLGINRAGLSSGLTGARGMVRGFVSQALGILAPLGAGFGVAASIGAASTQVAAEKKLQAVLKATAGAVGLTQEQIQSYAGDLQKLTNVGDEVTISGAAVLATFKEIKGVQFKEALASAQDLSAVMGQDLQSSIVQFGKALNDPAKGVTALSEVGVSFTQVQKDQIQALQQTGDLMGAQKIILAELKSEFGGAAQAMADPLTQTKNVVGDLAENLGLVLLPSVREIATAFNDTAGSIDQSQFKTIGENIALAIRNGSAIGQIALIDLLQAILELIPSSEGVVGEIVAVFGAGWTVAGKGFGVFYENVVGGFKEIMQAGEAVVAAIQAAFQALTSGENPLTAFADTFVETLASQSNVQVSTNLGELFAQTRQDLKTQFQQSGGVSNVLEARKQALLDQVGQAEAAKTARDAVAGAAPGGLTGPDVGGSRQAEVKSNAGFQAGTAEAYRAILTAQNAANPNRKLENLAERQLAATEETNRLLGGGGPGQQMPPLPVAEGV